jgi:hypothetical protein
VLYCSQQELSEEQKNALSILHLFKLVLFEKFIFENPKMSDGVKKSSRHARQIFCSIFCNRFAFFSSCEEVKELWIGRHERAFTRDTY